MKTDRIYVTPSELVYFTPDGVGRVYFETVNEAKDETGLDKVVFLIFEPEIDDDWTE